MYILLKYVYKHVYNIYTYKRVVCVCLLVSLLFIGHTRFPTLRRCLRVREQEPSRAAPHERASMHSESTRAHAVQLLNEKIVALMHDAFQKQNRTRAHAIVYVTADNFKKKGKRKPTCHFTSSVYNTHTVQFAFSWSVYFPNRTESYSSQIEFAGPHGITENQATYLHCGGEARVKKRARPPATCRKASTGKTGADTGPEDVDVDRLRPKPMPRSTKTTIMTVHVNPIMQAAPSQRRIISIIEASNQLLFHSQKLLFVE